MVRPRLYLYHYQVIAATAHEVQLTSPGEKPGADYVVTPFAQQVGGGFLSRLPQRYPRRADSRNGAHVVRWIGLGPRRRMAARCAGVA